MVKEEKQTRKRITEITITTAIIMIILAINTIATTEVIDTFNTSVTGNYTVGVGTATLTINYGTELEMIHQQADNQKTYYRNNTQQLNKTTLEGRTAKSVKIITNMTYTHAQTEGVCRQSNYLKIGVGNYTHYSTTMDIGNEWIPACCASANYLGDNLIKQTYGFSSASGTGVSYGRLGANITWTFHTNNSATITMRDRYNTSFESNLTVSTTGLETYPLLIMDSIESGVTCSPDSLSIVIWNQTNEYEDYVRITAYNITSGQNINTFNITINGTLYNTTTGSIDYYGIPPITINSNITSPGFNTRTLNNYNITNYDALNISLIPEGTYLINITINKPDGTPLTSPGITINGTIKSGMNPYQEEASNYINYSNPETTTLEITITDPLGRYPTRTSTVTFNITDLSETITMGTATLMINTYSCIGALTNTTSRCFGQNSTTYTQNIIGREDTFNTTPINISTSNYLETSPVYCLLNINAGTANWTNYYEFITDGAQDKTIDLRLLCKNDYYMYIRVMDAGTTSKIKDATVQMYCNNATNEPLTFVGQRLTDVHGSVLFALDTNTACIAIASANGHTTEARGFKTSDETYTKDAPSEPFDILLRTDITNNDNLLQYIGITSIRDKTEDIIINILAKNATTIQTNTQYMIDHGITSKLALTKTEEDGYLWTGTLISGTHYTSLTGDNITLYIYADESTTANITHTIVYTGNYTNEIFGENTFAGQSKRAVNILLMILLLTASFTVGILIKGADAGTHTFYIGTVIITGISMSFAWIALISMSYYGLKQIRKVISE